MPIVNGNQNAKKEEDFAGKKLRTLPEELLQRGGDTVKVDLQRNRLKQISGIAQLRNLTELNLSRNEFTEFPVEIRGLRQLEKLYVNQNNIKTIPENVFPSLEKLQFLKLSTNKLVMLPQDINRCQHLNYLNLSNNCLKNLDPLVGLSQLEELYVERNQLTDLPDLLFQNSSLTLFKANGNPLRKPPREVCAGGLKDIKSYFSMLEANAPNEKTVKTMFLGTSMAGKSTLSLSLKQGCPVPVAEEDRTIGIEISEVDSEGIRFIFWDFAGQEEYYITHHVFITSQAFVILAINLSSYNMDAQSFEKNVGFWIKNLQLKIPESVVLPVGTHVDQCTDENEVDKKKKHIKDQVDKMLQTHRTNLQQRKKNLDEKEDSSSYRDQINQIEWLIENELMVLDLVPIDCTKKEDIVKLRTHIKKEILNKAFPSIERTLPRCYYEVEKDIKELKQNGDIAEHGIVSQSTLLNDLKNRQLKNSLDDDNLKLILQYLHRIGVIMWYKEIPELEDLLFVEPSFLISLFKTIVRHDLVQELNRISPELLKSENALAVQKKRWISDYKDRASLNNVAIRILVRTELQKHVNEEKDLIDEVVGSSKKEGSLLSLLKNFDVCLPTKHNSPLNPNANEFCPENKKNWKPSNPVVYEPDACLFPIYLQDNKQVEDKWESDNPEDLNIHVFFLPEIPHGFFHRLVIRACSFYSPYWIGKDQCVLCCGDKRFLLREHREEDQFIEIRYKETELETPADFQKAWEVIREIMIRLNTLTGQWQGLYLTVHSPCKSSDCDDYFEWNDWQEWLEGSGTSKFNIGLEEKQTCRNGHQRRTEFLFPRIPDAHLT